MPDPLGPGRPALPRAARPAEPRVLGGRHERRGPRAGLLRRLDRHGAREARRGAERHPRRAAPRARRPAARRRARARAPLPARQLRDRPAAQLDARAPARARRALRPRTATSTSTTRAHPRRERRGRAARRPPRARPRRVHAGGDRPEFRSPSARCARGRRAAGFAALPAALGVARRRTSALRDGGSGLGEAAAISARKTGPRSRAFTSPMPRMPRRRSGEVGLAAASSWSVRSPKIR